MQKLSFLPTLPSLLAAPETPLIHRDLSWLQFNDRVLGESRAPGNPLLERVKFLAISASNLDEFFVIRLSSLTRSIARAKVGPKDQPPSATYQHLSRTAESIFEIIAKFGAKQVEALELLSGELEHVGIQLHRQARPGTPGFDIGRELFNEQILPQLSAPETFSIQQLSNLENLQLAAIFPGGQFLRIPKSISSVLYRENHFFFLDDLLATHLGPAFGIEGIPGIVRLSRDGDFSVDLEEEDTESIPDIVRTSLKRREKGRVVRLQYLGPLSEQILHKCISQFRLTHAQIFPAPGSMVLQGLWALFQHAPQELVEKQGLKYPPHQAAIPRPLRDKAHLFDELKQQDFLLHHPYDSFDAFVGWIEAACNDPLVSSIEQTVYRMDAVSPVIEALKHAAAAGKTVRVFIELRARFDELNNLRLADELRKAGIEVYFGFGKLKLHAKIALITRNETSGARYYTHLSTGNYNAATARQYTDLAILTGNQEIGHDARHFFSSVMKGEVPVHFKVLLSAPTRLHRRLIADIQGETRAAKAGKPARIVAKVNALVDELVIEQLYKASQAGVKVDLIVRGACSLVPGVQGLSDNIRVISIVDRFLEHSRLYYFESRQSLYLSSADWMPRNFFSRLEIAFPVQDPLLRKYLIEFVIPTYLNDNVKARELTPQGTWKKRPTRGGKAIRSQFVFEESAAKQYRGTPLE
jgi:polyphosphate kinase